MSSSGCQKTKSTLLPRLIANVTCTVKQVNNSTQGQVMYKWPLFGGYIVLFNQGRVTEVCFIYCVVFIQRLYLTQVFKLIICEK